MAGLIGQDPFGEWLLEEVVRDPPVVAVRDHVVVAKRQNAGDQRKQCDAGDVAEDQTADHGSVPPRRATTSTIAWTSRFSSTTAVG